MSITIPPGSYSQVPLTTTVPVVPITPSAVAPVVTTVPPPTSQYAAPSTSIRIPSYTPPPVPGFAAPQLTSSFVLPPLASPSAAPVYAAPTAAAVAAAKAVESAEEKELTLTRGFPDPRSIEEQKEAYSRSLEQQLEEGNQSLQKQNAERKKQLYEAAEQQKQALLLHMEQQVKIQEMALDEQTSQAMMGLKKAALDQRAALDQQAASLVLEYQQRKTHEEFAATQAEMKKQYLNSQNQLQSEATKFYSESQSKVQQELQRQHKERAEKLGDAASLNLGSAAPPASQGVVPAFGAAALGSAPTLTAVPAGYIAQQPRPLSMSYSALPSVQQVPMQPIAHYM